MRQDEEPQDTTVDERSPGEAALSRRDFLRFAGLAGASIGVGAGFADLLGACSKAKETTTTTAAGGAITTAATPTTTASAGPRPPAQDRIVIGAARSLSGPQSLLEGCLFGPAYRLWVEDINAAGGIDVAGKKLPVEMKVYDDESKIDTCIRLVVKLIEEDKVDFVLGPVGTDFLSAAADVTNAHKYILISTEGMHTTLETKMAMGHMPCYFQTTPSANHYQMPAFADICEELGIKRVAIIYLREPMGIDFQAQATTHLSARYIDVAASIAIPLDFNVDIFAGIIKQARDLDVDALCLFAFPDMNVLGMQTMIGLDYSPKAVLLGGGGAFPSFYDAFQGAMEGVMYIGAWSVNSSPEAKAYYDKLLAFVGGPENIEFSTQLLYRAQLEFFQQAIEQAATLDQDVIAQVMRTAHFRTSISPDTFFTNQSLDFSCYAGQIGQWQKAIAEVVDVGDKRTAAPIYPKAPWSQPPPVS
jgi:branched-chain amino acid transport system substrate-binding protein